MTKRYLLLLSALLYLSSLSFSYASPAMSGGVWFNYRYVSDDDRDKETRGDIADEALILYVDDNQKDRDWRFSGELRIGPGSFTDPANNSSGDNFTLHKAWVAYEVDKNSEIKIGKSQVPFGWKTVNFWPGDILLGGYGDQMDVGVKYTSSANKLSYDLAYYHADDWGETSTDSTDDNRHWGSSTTYRKVQTVVANADYALNKMHTVGVSLQAGKLQDLTTSPFETSGDHSALNLHHYGYFDAITTRFQYIGVQRELPGSTTDIENWRAALEVIYTSGKTSYYIDASFADTDTTGNSSDAVSSHALGLSYNYGPGWMYFEYLTQDGFIGTDGDIGEGDFDAVYATIDYYF